MIDYSTDLQNQICIEIGKESSSVHAWIGNNDVQSVEYSPHGDLAWLGFLQEQFGKMGNVMTIPTHDEHLS